MPPGPSIDRAFRRAIERLARLGMTNAEIVRALQPLTAEIGSPAPSYSAVRRIASPTRRARQANPYVDEVIEKLLTGRLPDFYAVDSRLELQAPSGPREAVNRVRRAGS